MTLYTFPGYNDEPQNAESALQEWIDTFDAILDDEEWESLFSFTNSDQGAEFNIVAIEYGATYTGINLEAMGYPLPTKV
jgi:hypothetical protein